jgi:hypothetical protein
VISDRPPLFTACVEGYAAVVIAGILDEILPDRLIAMRRAVQSGRQHPSYVAEVERAWAAMRRAAEEYGTWWRAEAAAEAEAHVTEAAAESPAEIDTNRAALLLAVTPSRVRQMLRCGTLCGRRDGRAWTVDRGSVRTYLMERNGSD